MAAATVLLSVAHAGHVDCGQLLLAQLVYAARLADVDPEAVWYCTSINRRKRNVSPRRSGDVKTWPVAMRGFYLYLRAEVEEAEGSPDTKCYYKIRVPSLSSPGDYHTVLFEYSTVEPAKYVCTCKWSAYHHTPCSHVYAATYAIIAPVLREYGFILDPRKENFIDTGDMVVYIPPRGAPFEERVLVNDIVPKGLCILAKISYIETLGFEEALKRI